MPRAINISDAEWQVMRVFWLAARPLTANDVVNSLKNKTDWNPRTIKTLLNRLIKKKALGYTPQGKTYLYHARVSQDDCIKSESRSFLARVFGGDSAAMLAHFVKHSKLSPEDVAQLKRILAGKEKGL